MQFNGNNDLKQMEFSSAGLAKRFGFCPTNVAQMNSLLSVISACFPDRYNQLHPSLFLLQRERA